MLVYLFACHTKIFTIMKTFSQCLVQCSTHLSRLILWKVQSLWYAGLRQSFWETWCWGTMRSFWWCALPGTGSFSLFLLCTGVCQNSGPPEVTNNHPFILTRMKKETVVLVHQTSSCLTSSLSHCCWWRAILMTWSGSSVHGDGVRWFMRNRDTLRKYRISSWRSLSWVSGVCDPVSVAWWC